LYDSGEKARAVELLDHEIEVRKSNPRALLLKGRILMTEGQLSDAAAYARRVTALEPTSWTAHDLLGSAQAANGEMQSAAESLQEVVRLNPRAGGPRLKLAAVRAAGGDAARAIYTLEQTFPGEPAAAAAAANNIAWRLAGGTPQAVEAAMALAEYARDKLPNRAEPWDTLGSIYLARGDATRAVTAFEKSVQLAPDNPDYRERLLEARHR
jgi:cytochrome c-type biogenesis protein CcmH/NrfG